MFWCTGPSPAVLVCLLVDWSVSLHFPLVFLCPFAVLSRIVLMLLEGDIFLLVINESDLFVIDDHVPAVPDVSPLQLFQMFRF